MKKSVLALAALGAFAGGALAQSSVTMFGVVDVNVMTVDNDDRTYSHGHGRHGQQPPRFPWCGRPGWWPEGQLLA
jgi:predicted porin